MNKFLFLLALAGLSSSPYKSVDPPDVVYAIAPLVLGAAILGGTTLLGSAISGISNNKSITNTNNANLQAARETNEANKQMFQQQLDYNTQMFEEQKAYNDKLIQQMNDYNNPLNQRGRYENAGFNPYFMMGNIDAGQMQNAVGVSAPSAPSAPNMVTPQFQPKNYDFVMQGLRDVGSIMNSYFQNENLAASTEQQRIDNLTRLDTNIANLENLRSQKHLNQATIDRLDEEITDMRQQRQAILENMKLSNENLRNQNKLQDYEKQSKAIEIRISDLQEKYQAWMNDFAKKRGNKELEQLQAIIANTTADTAQKTAAAVLSRCQATGIKLDNWQKRALMPLLIEGAKIENEQKRLEMKYGTNAWTAGARVFDRFERFKRHNMEKTVGFNRTMRW